MALFAFARCWIAGTDYSIISLLPTAHSGIMSDSLQPYYIEHLLVHMAVVLSTVNFLTPMIPLSTFPSLLI